MEYVYIKDELVKDNAIKSNNWKRMHGIPLKAMKVNKNGVRLTISSPKYVSRRSQKKKKKAHFRRSFSFIVAMQLKDNPKAWKIYQIYHRYGYMKKKCKKKPCSMK